MMNMEEEIACMLHNTTQEQLSCLNGVKAMLYMPVTIFLGLLIIVGTLGNITVCLVYYRRRIRVSSHYFILSLAVLDLTTCVVGMPTEMADLILPLTFESPIACKVLRFLHSSTIIASSTILIEVAFDRYFRICKLGQQFTANKARLLCLGALMMGVTFSWPSFVIFGKKTVDILINGHLLHGTDCTTDDSMRETIWPTIYYLFLFSLFGITLAFFTVLYSKIGLRIMNQNKIRAGSSGCAGPMSPQDKLAHVLRAGMKTDMETPSAELSSDPGSPGHSSTSGSFRSSGISGSFGTSGSSRSSGASGASGSSSRSTRHLIESAATTRQGVQAQAKAATLDRLQVPNLISEQAVVKRMLTLSVEALEEKLGRENASGASIEVCNANENEISVAVNDGNNDNNDTNSNNNNNNSNNNNSNNNNSNNNNSNNNNSNNNNSNNNNSNNNNSNNNNSNNNNSNNNNSNNNTIDRPNKYNRRLTSRRNTECDEEYDTLPRKCRNKKQKTRNLKGLSCCCQCEQNQADERTNYYQHPLGDKSAYSRQHSQEAAAHLQRTCNRQLRVGKTTTVLFAVTLAYILSFLPYLTVMVMRSVVKGLEDSLSPMGELAYKFCVKSFFINNAINPVIYSFLNQAFRKDATRMLRNIFGRRKRSSSNCSASM